MPSTPSQATVRSNYPGTAAWSLLWALSGFSMLTLETVWMREAAVRAGNTAVASALVMAVFFVSAALGNLLGARLVAGSPVPLRWYARFEILAGLAALAGLLLERTLVSGSILAGTLVLAAPASLLSGVSFPSLAEAFVTRPEDRTARGGVLYGMNLLGAALGVAAGGVLLPWWLGNNGAFGVAVAAQLAGGALAWRLARPAAPVRRSKPERLGSAPAPVPPSAGWLLLALSGFLSLAAQSLSIVWARQVFEGSIYVLCGVLAGFVGGLGLGSLAAAALRRSGRPPMDLLPWFAGAGAVLLLSVPAVGGWSCAREMALSAGTPAGLLLEALARCSLPLLPVAFCLGGVFPLAWELAHMQTPSQGRMLGAAMALNKIAAGAGAAAALFWLMPAAGLIRGTQAVAWGYVLVALLPLLFTRPRSVRALLPAALPLAIGLVASLQAPQMPGLTPELRLISADEGAYGPVAVVEDRDTGSRHILLNTRQRLSGTRDALSTQQHQSWVPLLLCRNPEKVMSVGMAAGISAAAALDLPVKELCSVELVPEVARAAREHFSEWNARLFTDPRSRVIVDDGRRALARSGKLDAIVCDLFFPAEEGSALLYSREFFRLGLHRLRPGGVYCLWLPCYQHTPETAGMIARTFAEVFPHAVMVRAGFDPVSPVVGLIGSPGPIPLSRDFLAGQLATSWGRELAGKSPFFLSADHAWLLILCDLHSAEPSFADFPPTTDDRPLLAWLGPRKPRKGERLHGFPFLEWIGKRSLSGQFPSCDLGEDPPPDLLATIRAGNYYFAASAASVSVPGDPRPEAVRLRQVEDYLKRASELRPGLTLPVAPPGK